MILRYVGGLLLFLIGWFILSSKNLKKHPYQLIAIEMVMHGASYLSFVDNVRVFEVPFYRGLDLLLFWRTDITWREYY